MRSILLATILFLALPARAEIVLDPAYGDGIQDASAAFDAAIATACASTETRTVRVPVGVFRFTSKPADILCGVNLIGEGKGVSHLLLDYNPSSNNGEFIVFTGEQDEYGGASIRDLKLLIGLWNGGIALTVRAVPHYDPGESLRGPHGMLIDNIIIGRQNAHSGSWNYGIYLDGSLNGNPPPGVAAGIRDVRLRDTSVATARSWSYLFWHAHGITATMIDCVVFQNGVLFWQSNGGMVISQNCPITYR